jgi:hypothetical protein
VAQLDGRAARSTWTCSHQLPLLAIRRGTRLHAVTVADGLPRAQTEHARGLSRVQTEPARGLRRAQTRPLC